MIATHANCYHRNSKPRRELDGSQMTGAHESLDGACADGQPVGGFAGGQEVGGHFTLR